MVTIDGVVQYPNDSAGNIRAYSVAANVINFTTAPGSGTQIEVRHIGFAGATTGSGGGGVTGVYGRTGNVVLLNTDDITVNDAAITGNATITGDLTVNGTTVTLDTKLTEVDQILVGANNSTVAVAVTQSGSGDLLQLFDGSTEVFSVAENGGVGIADSIYHIGDDNTAIRFPSADTFRVDTGGSARLTVTDSATTFTSVINANNGIKITDSDNKSILLGEHDDMRIRHTGSHSEITDGGTGSLRLGGNNVLIGSATFGATMATYAEGGSVD